MDWFIPLAGAALTAVGAYFGVKKAADAQLTGVRQTTDTQLTIAREQRDLAQQTLDEQRKQNELSRVTLERDRRLDPVMRRSDLLYSLEEWSEEIQGTLLEIRDNQPVPELPLTEVRDLNRDVKAQIAAGIHSSDADKKLVELTAAADKIDRIIDEHERLSGLREALTSNATIKPRVDLLLRIGRDKDLQRIHDSLFRAHLWCGQALGAKTAEERQQALSYVTQGVGSASGWISVLREGGTLEEVAKTKIEEEDVPD